MIEQLKTGPIMGSKVTLDDMRSIWVGRYEGKTLIDFVNHAGEHTSIAISSEARSALLQLLLADVA